MKLSSIFMKSAQKVDGNNFFASVTKTFSKKFIILDRAYVDVIKLKKSFLAFYELSEINLIGTNVKTCIDC